MKLWNINEEINSLQQITVKKPTKNKQTKALFHIEAQNKP